jgi:CheY-like chemotaxis protein
MSGAQIAPDCFLRHAGRKLARAPSQSPKMSAILLVEDDETLRYALERDLADAGHEVIAVASSMAALNTIFSKSRIDLLILDLVMQEGEPHGLAVARMARLHRGDLPVILITGYAELLDEVEHLPGKVLLKPIDSEALLREISALLSAVG